MRIRLLALIAVFALVAVACGNGGADDTTTTEGAGQTTAAPEGDSLALVQGETGGVSFSRLPAAVTRDRLNEEGWEIETVNFSATDLTVQAVSAGMVNVGRFQVLDALRAIQAGANLKIMASDRPDEFVVVTSSDVTDCADLEGDRVATHSESSTYTFLQYYYMEEICGVDLDTVERLIIPGGENRIIALMNGEVDTTNVQMADFINLEAQAPGQFHILANFSQEIPGLVGGVLVGNSDWLESNRTVAVDYLAAVLGDLHDANNDGSAIRAASEEYQSDADFQQFDTVRDVYLSDLGGFPECGVFDAESAQQLLTLFEDLELIDPGLTVEQVFDLPVLDDARAEVDHC